MNNRQAIDPVAELERLWSGVRAKSVDYGHFCDELVKYLKHPDPDIRRAVVTSQFAKSGAVTVDNALIDLLGGNYEDIARAAAKAIWERRAEEEQIGDRVDGLKWHIRSLRTEYEIPAHMSRDGARRGLDYLRGVLPTDEAKRLFDELVAEIWEGLL